MAHVYCGKSKKYYSDHSCHLISSRRRRSPSYKSMSRSRSRSASPAKRRGRSRSRSGSRSNQKSNVFMHNQNLTNNTPIVIEQLAHKNMATSHQDFLWNSKSIFIILNMLTTPACSFLILRYECFHHLFFEKCRKYTGKNVKLRKTTSGFLFYSFTYLILD